MTHRIRRARLRDIASGLHAARQSHPLQHRRRAAVETPQPRPPAGIPGGFAGPRGVRDPPREKGHDIDAACGQLRLKTEQDRTAGPAA